MHKTTNLWKLELNWSSKLQDNGRKKHPCHSKCKVVCFQMLDLGTSKLSSEVSKPNSNILVENNFFHENYVTRGSRFHSVLYNQQLSIACYQVSFYDNNYFEKSAILSSAIKCSPN